MWIIFVYSTKRSVSKIEGSEEAECLRRLLLGLFIFADSFSPILFRGALVLVCSTALKQRTNAESRRLALFELFYLIFCTFIVLLSTSGLATAELRWEQDLPCCCRKALLLKVPKLSIIVRLFELVWVVCRFCTPHHEQLISDRIVSTSALVVVSLNDVYIHLIWLIIIADIVCFARWLYILADWLAARSIASAGWLFELLTGSFFSW